jgi:hypothetical protein
MGEPRSAFRPGGEPLDALERGLATALAAGRLAIGMGLWLAPGISARALGLNQLDPRALALARIAASRDLVLGTWQLRSLGDRAELRRATTAVAIADGGDTLAFGLALARPEIRTAALRGLAGAGPATLAGAWLVRRLADKL